MDAFIYTKGVDYMQLATLHTLKVNYTSQSHHYAVNDGNTQVVVMLEILVTLVIVVVDASNIGNADIRYLLHTYYIGHQHVTQTLHKLIKSFSTYIHIRSTYWVHMRFKYDVGYSRYTILCGLYNNNITYVYTHYTSMYYYYYNISLLPSEFSSLGLFLATMNADV